MAKKAGRSSSYTDEIADVILERIALGESLVRICRDDDMPSHSSVFRWLADPAREAFRDKYARARDAQADTKFDQIGDIAHQAVAGEVHPQAARVFIDAVKWQASKLAPKKYGDSSRQEIEHSFSDSLSDRLAAARKRAIDGGA